MCGILGHFSHSKEVSESDFRKALECLYHRGPDNQAIRQFDDGFFGHLRLAIIDLDESSNQPFSFGNYHMVFNGEIYNYMSVRDYLAKKFLVQYKTHSDTEVILHAYIHLGPDCVKLFNGMFAFCIYDKEKNILFSARDRVGKKPFYYRSTGSSFSFASEIKSILQMMKHKPAISNEAVAEFLSIGYIVAPATVYEGISKLEPGHHLTVDLKDYSVKKVRYWHPLTDKPDDERDLETIIRDSVDIRYVADVPVGIMLSGGLDSNIVLGLSKDRHPETFTIKSDQSDYDESDLAAYSSKFFGCENFSKVNVPQPGVIDKLVYHYDEPMSDSSAIPTMLLSEFIRGRGYKCVLNGDGADEVFGGYDRYRFLLIYKYLRFVRFFIPSFSSNAFKYKGLFYNLRQLKKLLSEPDIIHAYAERTLINKGFEGSKLKGSNYKQHLVDRIKSVPVDGLNKFMVFDYLYYLPDDLLVKMDRATMAHSLEGRSPFLDYRLFEKMWRRPYGEKVSLFRNKKPLRRLFNDLLPSGIKKAKKRGFQVPIDHWFLNELKDQVLALKTSHIVKDGYVSGEYIDNVVDTHLSKKENLKFQIYTLLFFDKWYNRWVKG